ncbi:HI0074 family nucleotidyltransferase substrate-binding subunit [Aquibacillus sp. LR5S19]|uniref:HI0074 family nucleotidyltransferase substrate-binding subunit n=2 Tax=Aquibacillus rhizosphaerae TaxID=3051431 RepID=A0ABT7L020_9BACI|nr:HI0074 family nucleotidyltransferase substrate-binding subunit [Aquibacillus sp. LR5S19]MDL4839116.1 HI0074 family nucleotidyltransferase substrate-binding subunit [Aquibacillus sp. LR5S19]
MEKESAYGLTSNTFYTIINTLKKYSNIIEKVILFGSRARGDYKITSDIDLAIIFRTDNEKIYKIIDDLSEKNIIHTLDIIDYNKINNQKLKNYIDNEGKIIFLTNSDGKVVDNMNKVLDKVIDLEKAIKKLHETLERDATNDDIVIDATIQRFEFTYELSWKILKAYLEYNGLLEVSSPRRTLKEAFKERIITDGDNWLKMLVDRNRTSHPYEEATAWEIYSNIKSIYIKLFDELLIEMKRRV